MSEASSSMLDFTNPRLEWHMQFICPECGAEHRSQQEWRRHLNDAHDYLRKSVEDFDFKEINDRYHECQICRKWVANAHQAIALLQYHRFLHLPFSRTYRCRHCTGAFTRKRALCEHLYRFHSRLIGRMEKLRRSDYAAEIAAIRSPKENPEFYLRFICPQCGKLIDRFAQWLHHLNTAHHSTSTDLKMHRITGTRNHYCMQCKKLFYTSDKARLQRHRFTHLPHKQFFQCNFCTVKKTYKSEILRHFIRMHPRNFAEAKQYIRKPEEWGGVVSDRLNRELTLLLHGDSVEAAGAAWQHNRVEVVESNSDSQTDILQKALLDSLIDLETVHTKPAAIVSQSTNANEYALDQSLNDLEAVLRDDLKQSCVAQQSLICANRENLDALELEALCEEMFEEIVEDLEPKHEYEPLTDAATQREILKDETTNVKVEVKSESEDDKEKIISLEIDAVGENEQKTAMAFTSPRRKRLKRTNDDSANASANGDTDTTDNFKQLLEAHIHYLCIECGKELEHHSAWREHIFNEHNISQAIEKNFQLLEDEQSYLCLECMQVQHTTKLKQLQRHRLMHMPYQSYLKCKFCDKTKSSKPKMLHHLQEFHAQALDQKINAQVRARKFKCNDCWKEFKTQTRWQNHRAQCWQRVSSTSATTRNYNISENLKLITHLKLAHRRIELIAAEINLNKLAVPIRRI